MVAVTLSSVPASELVGALGLASAVAVVERTDEPLAAHNPLTREVRAALFGLAEQGRPVPQVVSVAAGLGSRDVAAGDLAAAFTWASDRTARTERPFVVLGLRHPLALEPEPVEVRPAGAWSVRGHSVGGFGSVTTNKLVATLCGELFGLQVQAYPRYGSEKKGLPTTYYLTIADAPIRQHAELAQVEFVPVHDVSAFAFARPLDGLVDGDTVFLNSALPTAEAVWASLPVPARAEVCHVASASSRSTPRSSPGAMRRGPTWWSGCRASHSWACSFGWPLRKPAGARYRSDVRDPPRGPRALLRQAWWRRRRRQPRTDTRDAWGCAPRRHGGGRRIL